jgi:transcriptional regulator of arginine metabolism
MPTDPRARRRRLDAVREMLLSDDPPADQAEIVERLEKLDISSTQSSVSRDLRQLGAVRIEGFYRIPSWLQDEDTTAPFRRVLPFIIRAQAIGPNITLIATSAGAGHLVAEVLESSEWEDVDGIVAGHSSVLLLTQHKFFQDLVFGRLKYYMDSEFGEGEHDAIEEQGEL